MTSAAVQTVWAELIAATLADAGVTTCVISPGSRSTPLAAALAQESRLELATIIDERAAAFFALGAARATGRAAAVVCTSGTAAAHYLPAIVEASLAGVPLLAITADRPPELQACGASQTIDQVGMYGGFVRGAFDLGAPVGQEQSLRAVRRKLVQAITLARGPHAGPVHLEVPLRKPLEPAPPSTDGERALAAAAHALRGPVRIAPPGLTPDPEALHSLAAAIAAEPDGVIVAGALPGSFAAAREAVFALAARAGYPVLAEAGSQLRFCARPANVVFVDHADLIPLAHRPAPKLILQLGAEPVAASWPAWIAATRAKRYVLAGPTWVDPDNGAALVVLGGIEVALGAIVDALAKWGPSPFSRMLASDRRASNTTLPSTCAPHDAVARESADIAQTQKWGRSPFSRTLLSDGANAATGNAADAAAHESAATAHDATTVSIARASSQRIRSAAWLDTWRDAEARAATAMERALSLHARNEASVVRAAIDAVPVGGAIQIGNSLPIRVVDQVCTGNTPLTVLTQRGAAGIDGLIASAAGATRDGKPVLLVLGDVSFAHDVGGLLAARCATAPLAVLVVDNRGGQIFGGLPVARANLGPAFDRHFTTTPELDPSAVASAFGARAITAASPAAVASAIASALAAPGLTVIHAPVSTSGAHDVRRTAIELFDARTDVRSAGGTHE